MLSRFINPLAAGIKLTILQHVDLYISVESVQASAALLGHQNSLYNAFPTSDVDVLTCCHWHLSTGSIYPHAVQG